MLWNLVKSRADAPTAAFFTAAAAASHTTVACAHRRCVADVLVLFRSLAVQGHGLRRHFGNSRERSAEAWPAAHGLGHSDWKASRPWLGLEGRAATKRPGLAERQADDGDGKRPFLVDFGQGQAARRRTGRAGAVAVTGITMVTVSLRV